MPFYWMHNVLTMAHLIALYAVSAFSHDMPVLLVRTGLFLVASAVSMQYNPGWWFEPL